MICKLCSRFYLDEDSIVGLFSFSEICENCNVKYAFKHLHEVIPVDKGLIEYHYLYENLNLSRKQIDYLSKYLSLLYIFINRNKNQYDLIIYLDDNIFYNSPIFGSFINDFKHIFIFSLKRKELIYKDIF